MVSVDMVGREAIAGALDALDSAVDTVVGLAFGPLTTREWLMLLERIERVRRKLPTGEHGPINLLARLATLEELGPKLSHLVAEWALISRSAIP
ncbi:hypothetical protein [Mycobacterium marinum]|uniref:hypothetical protein n=1 Tax=Mycobacterium marinum TaxID=1781 RepID=UPI000E3EB6E2|nr:hypothetical protein [Mycobacterium marinum]